MSSTLPAAAPRRSPILWLVVALVVISALAFAVTAWGIGPAITMVGLAATAIMFLLFHLISQV
ncbi:MAG: hypothetical protein ABS58_10575 [Mesorhizobium sp. SCN 65-20]|nr:MAG: hypothetical protein ABS58_10575 [Mesorhizobium sp. SCN 65-20]